MTRSLLLGTALLVLLAIPPALPAAAAGLPCSPCSGVRLSAGANAGEVLDALHAQYQLKPGSPLFIAWDLSLETPETPEAPDATASTLSNLSATALAAAGATPWLTLTFRTPGPLARDPQHLTQLQAELQTAARLAAAAPAGSWFQIVWRPAGAEGAVDLAEYGFLLKRAAVALTGARPEAKVATMALADGEAVTALYAQEVAAYLEAIVLRPGSPEAVALAVAAAGKADPGRPVVIDGLPLPADCRDALAEAARWHARGIALTLFRADGPVRTATLVPFAVLAREFAGDLSYDPATVPTGAGEAWAFVRGKDLGLRVIATVPGSRPAGSDLTLHFTDPSLRRPVTFPLAPGKVAPPAGRVGKEGFDVSFTHPGPVVALGLDRLTAEERQGLADKVTVSGEREIAVEEILRRLQAFEDAQSRRLDHYQALNTTHLRFQLSGTGQGFEATLEGPFFFHRGSPGSAGSTDWAWETLYLNGVRWKSKTIPEMPLVQPEKAAALPLEIHFTRQYRYRLRGSETIDGRAAWVIDFTPEGPAAESDKLYRGTVWIDKELAARLRTKAVQVGLTGEVISNEETQNYRPIDALGKPAPWASESYVLPLSILAQQILSVVNSTTVVERATELSHVVINGDGFAAERQKVQASDVTMVRDTERGLRYLVKEGEASERVVQDGFAKSKLFAIGGLFYDSALKFPLPLAGVNYFSLDFRGTGQQVNVFFAGALLTASVAQPRVFGSKVDAGATAFAIAFPLTDNLYRNGKEITREEVQSRPATFAFKLGRPVGEFFKLSAGYSLFYSHFKRSDNTDASFVLPADNLLQSIDLGGQYARSGYKLIVAGSFNRRSKWDFWGLPGNAEFDPKDQKFTRWQASLSKNWYLPAFQRVSAEVDYVGGQQLDRFSKYQFGFFGTTRVHGYQSNRVRATTAVLGHLTYGFEINQSLHLDVVGDYGVATDRRTGLNREKLGGVGLVGSFIGPWSTLVNLDVGFPVLGPANGFVMYLAFLKLFK